MWCWCICSVAQETDRLVGAAAAAACCHLHSSFLTDNQEFCSSSLLPWSISLSLLPFCLSTSCISTFHNLMTSMMIKAANMRKQWDQNLSSSVCLVSALLLCFWWFRSTRLTKNRMIETISSWELLCQNIIPTFLNLLLATDLSKTTTVRLVKSQAAKEKQW